MTKGTSKAPRETERGILVEVTPRDIRRAQRYGSRRNRAGTCPISQALIRMFPEAAFVSTAGDGAQVVLVESPREEVRYHLSRRAERLQTKFDNDPSRMPLVPIRFYMRRVTPRG